MAAWRNPQRPGSHPRRHVRASSVPAVGARQLGGRSGRPSTVQLAAPTVVATTAQALAGPVDPDLVGRCNGQGPEERLPSLCFTQKLDPQHPLQHH